MDDDDEEGESYDNENNDDEDMDDEIVEKFLCKILATATMMLK